MRRRAGLVALLLLGACASDSASTPAAEETASTASTISTVPEVASSVLPTAEVPIVESTDLPSTSSMAPSTSADPAITPLPEQRMLTGSITLTGKVVGAWNACQGRDDLSDVTAGMKIVVRSGDGTVLAVTAAENLSDADAVGPWQAEHQTASGGTTLISIRCIFKFAAELPPVDFYEVAIGDRFDVVYSTVDLDSAGWHITFLI